MTDQNEGDQQAKGAAAPVPEIYLPNYRIGKTLGIGSFGKVKVAEHVLTGHKVAIKILNRKKIKAIDMEEKVRREIKILRLFMHPHIIRLYEVLETPHDIFVVMEYVKGGELFDYIVEKGRLGENEARHFFQQIVSGVEYCHRNMVVHRDLKPENLLKKADGTVKICDFGVSELFSDEDAAAGDAAEVTAAVGTPAFLAPEIAQGGRARGKPSDIWSLGVCLYYIVCGAVPFPGSTVLEVTARIMSDEVLIPPSITPSLGSLLKGILDKNPATRMTLEQIMRHEWVTKGCT
mmetsp:Transcript_30867/g.76776  ORF Transcript_30867/g.76776 Transcript_30867/m.76776 type:complete len:291 (-) Transcript_30867:2-874(-)